MNPAEAAELREIARRVGARLVSPADAEDVAQEAVLRATRDWARIGAYARPWIVRVATNLAIAQLRRDGRAHDVVIREPSPEGQADLRVDLAEAVRSLPCDNVRPSSFATSPTTMRRRWPRCSAARAAR